MAHRPSFQFYPADWLNDPKLALVDWEAKGLWMDLLCYMHNEDHYGYLRIGDQYLDQNAIQRLLKANARRFHRVFKALQNAGIIRHDKLGFYSKRMVEDERLRRVRAESGGKGGNPNLVNQKENQKSKQKPTPSSSSSSPSSENNHPSDGHASGAPASRSENPIWGDGLRLLLEAGVNDRSARQFLGRALKQYGEGAVNDAISATMLHDPADPKDYLMGCLRRNREDSAYKRSEKRYKTPGELKVESLLERF